MTDGNESRVGVACIQMQPEIGAKTRNVAHSVGLVAEIEQELAWLGSLFASYRQTKEP